MAKEPLGVTFIVPPGQEATGVYEDENGVDVFETDVPYLLTDGKSLEAPLPVKLSEGRIYFDSLGNPQTALGVHGLTPPVWSPFILFSNGERGAWYDPSDLTTLFQDAAGTIPVTADGQPVGRILDKSGKGNHATQSATASRPTYKTNGTLSWLAFDGVDDFLVTGSIDFSAKDEVTQMLGLSNAALNSTLIMELSTSSYAINGSFGVYTTLTSQLGVSSRGTAISPLAVTRSTPFSGVATGLSKISADINLLRHNGTQIGSNSADQGTGNYGTYPIYIGRRGGTTQAFSGNIHGLIVRGALTGDPDLSKAERWMAARTGVTL